MPRLRAATALRWFDSTARTNSNPGLRAGVFRLELYDRHLKSIDKVGGLDDGTFEGLNKALGRLERFWVDQILYKP